MSVRHRSLEPTTFRPRDWRSTTELRGQIKLGAATGIEPVTSCTRSRNHTSKPRGRCSCETATSDAQESDDNVRPDTGTYTKTQEPKSMGRGAGGGAGSHLHPEIKSGPAGPDGSWRGGHGCHGHRVVIALSLHFGSSRCVGPPLLPQKRPLFRLSSILLWHYQI